jgi:hypothetical protein
MYPQLQDHPKDVEFLNCPIRFYIEMESIFGHAMVLVVTIAYLEPPIIVQ